MRPAVDVVVTAGDPDATELAVLAAVLHRRAAATAAAARPPRPAPAWLRAARQEGVGGRRIGSPTALRTPGG